MLCRGGVAPLLDLVSVPLLDFVSVRLCLTRERTVSFEILKLGSSTNKFDSLNTALMMPSRHPGGT
eukprot:CAMPEP_0119006908 /NCGR_PEP_ID=MMETSP1176-20130426/2630_1 /TAXON_ID=265551 /ORGANISM="Synedropsis recta cf, Strain CCMP1620" /LENGTH=65 /DNA_ID=CAMNT_0006958937 /DNA_START=1 /DNA_END=194 /DNA_ORIENTATION=-